MVSRFDEDAAVYNEDLIYFQGEQVALHPGGGTPATVDALVSQEVAEERIENDAIMQVRTRTIKVRAADAGEPTAKARATIGGIDYHVESQAAPTGGLVQMKLVRQETSERSKANYRK